MFLQYFPVDFDYELQKQLENHYSHNQEFLEVLVVIQLITCVEELMEEYEAVRKYCLYQIFIKI